ncbi:MAG: hypothetical protein IRZ00_19620 [Gemmatimonadetes bacterium]|nr:hypothetical protein [Gemmatimonadota bacterium]
MQKVRTKEAAEAILRELPSVLGAYVREDVYGHPREVHLLVGPGPNVKNLARDVRDLLEERLRVPVDQRIISIAQVDRIEDATTEPAAPAGEEPAPAEPEADAALRRLLFGGIEAMVRDARFVARVRLLLGEREFVGEAAELDTGNGRVRAAALATLRAVVASTGDVLRLDLDTAALVRAFGREYSLVSVLASGAGRGRRPLNLVGAQPVEGDEATAAALAALKAVNRTTARQLRTG